MTVLHLDMAAGAEENALRRLAPELLDAARQAPTPKPERLGRRVHLMELESLARGMTVQTPGHLFQTQPLGDPLLQNRSFHHANTSSHSGRMSSPLLHPTRLRQRLLDLALDLGAQLLAAGDELGEVAAAGVLGDVDGALEALDLQAQALGLQRGA